MVSNYLLIRLAYSLYAVGNAHVYSVVETNVDAKIPSDYREFQFPAVCLHQLYDLLHSWRPTKQAEADFVEKTPCQHVRR